MQRLNFTGEQIVLISDYLDSLSDKIVEDLCELLCEDHDGEFENYIFRMGIYMHPFGFSNYLKDFPNPLLNYRIIHPTLLRDLILDYVELYGIVREKVELDELWIDLAGTHRIKFPKDTI